MVLSRHYNSLFENYLMVQTVRGRQMSVITSNVKTDQTEVEEEENEL